MNPADLLTLSLAVYLLTDILVNRALPFGVMTRIRDRLQWQGLNCFYCSATWAGFIVTGLWLIEPRLLIPLAGAGGAILLWRHTGSNHT